MKLLLLLVCCSALGQEVTYKTNRLTSVESFRRVNGQLYNTEKSVLFATYDGRVDTVFSNGFIFQDLEKTPIYETVRRRPDAMVSHGNFLGSSTSSTAYEPYKRKIGETEVLGEKFFVTNYPWRRYPTTGSSQVFQAMRVGTIQIGADVLKVIDYGTPNEVEVVTAITNAPMKSADRSADAEKLKKGAK